MGGRELGSVSRTTLYAPIARRRLKTAKLDRSRFVVVSSLDKLISRLAA